MLTAREVRAGLTSLYLNQPSILFHALSTGQEGLWVMSVIHLGAALVEIHVTHTVFRIAPIAFIFPPNIILLENKVIITFLYDFKYYIKIKKTWETGTKAICRVTHVILQLVAARVGIGNPQKTLIFELLTCILHLQWRRMVPCVLVCPFPIHRGHTPRTASIRFRW